MYKLYTTVMEGLCSVTCSVEVIVTTNTLAFIGTVYNRIICANESIKMNIF